LGATSLCGYDAYEYNDKQPALNEKEKVAIVQSGSKEILRIKMMMDVGCWSL
jgi:hypothetical protein